MSRNIGQIEQLLTKSGLKKAELARRTKISYSHILSILNGGPVSETYAQRIVNCLNQELGTDYTIHNLDFNIAERQ